MYVLALDSGMPMWCARAAFLTLWRTQPVASCVVDCGTEPVETGFQI